MELALGVGGRGHLLHALILAHFSFQVERQPLLLLQRSRKPLADQVATAQLAARGQEAVGLGLQLGVFDGLT